MISVVIYLEENQLIIDGEFLLENSNFEHLLLFRDPLFALNYSIALKAWRERAPSKRKKLAPKKLFEMACEKQNVLESLEIPCHIEQWKKFQSHFKNLWKESYI